jgi:AraC family transcriptional regulator, regulatory protein of adaptative response / methylated-DNA-[protein]-cysteine methyltransferase
MIERKKTMSLSAKNARLVTSTEVDPRWQSLVTRDPVADGKFYYSVKSTGVYCRPSCAARLARPENVQFHASWEDAERAGFRPCKRCKPKEPSLLEQHAKTIANICRLIESSDPVPPLEELANHAAMSPYHFHRLFKSITGLTPKGYATAHRAARVRDDLGRSRTVTEAVYGAGYNSSGRFYAQSTKLLGMTPTTFRAGGAGTEIRFAIGESSLGSILIAKTERGVCAILLGDDPETLARDLQDRFPKADLIGGDGEFEQLVSQVVGFIDDPTRRLTLPLDIRGTAFQQRVWQALRDIPPGTTATYTEIAQRIGLPKAVRAVARACAANAIAVAIPCHRVVRTDGSLSGYRWGVNRKRALLDKEARARTRG